MGEACNVGHAWLRLHLEDGSAVEHAAHAQREHVRPSGLLQERLASDAEHAGPAWLRLQDGSAVEPVAGTCEAVWPCVGEACISCGACCAGTCEAGWPCVGEACLS